MIYIKWGYNAKGNLRVLIAYQLQLVTATEELVTRKKEICRKFFRIIWAMTFTTGIHTEWNQNNFKIHPTVLALYSAWISFSLFLHLFSRKRINQFVEPIACEILSNRNSIVRVLGDKGAIAMLTAAWVFLVIVRRLPLHIRWRTIAAALDLHPSLLESWRAR